MTRSRPAAGGGRTLGVAPERLGGWLDGVAARHGAFADVRVEAENLRIGCADGTALTLTAPFGWQPAPPLLASFTAAVQQRRRVAVLLVRRGRWAVGDFDGAALIASKVDSRLVQGRTAAGGWSQQRFARRRDNQTAAVVTHAVATAARVLLPQAAAFEWLVTGGDRGLAADVLADPRLDGLAALPRLAPLEVGEPTKAVLLDTPQQFRAVRVLIVDPA